MKKIKTGNKSLDLWINFFHKSKDNNKFIYYVQKLDRTFLSYENDFDPEQEMFENIPRRGFLEADFNEIRKGLDKEGVNNLEEKTRLVIAMTYGVDFKQWVPVYKDEIALVFSKALIDGTYEEYGIELEKIINIAIESELIDKYDFLGVALIRGSVLAKRYPNEQALENLEKLKIKNAQKLKLHSLLSWL